MKEIMKKAGSFIIKCRRVWHVIKKPTKKEFSMIAKVSAMGILAFGVIGYLISLVMKTFV